MNKILKNAKLLTVVLPATLLVGCHSYYARHEGITTHAGETSAHNEAISVVDTWPDGFDNTYIPTDGQRQSKAIEKYKNPPKEKKSSAGTLKIVAGD